MLDEIVQESFHVADAYVDAERRIVERIAAHVANGVGSPNWEVESLRNAQSLRRESVAILAQAGDNHAQAFDALAGKAYTRAGAASLRDLPIADVVHAGSLQKRSAVRSVAREVSGVVRAADSQILRKVDDVFRSTVGKTTRAVVARGISRKEAAKEALNDLVKQGEVTFTDKRGRNWRLPDYVDMATRTGVAKAQMKGHEDTLRANGVDYVVVQPGPRACPICDKWARSILSTNGVAGTQRTENIVSGNSTTVTVDATLDQARLAGFQHPNCRCSLRAYLPGVTKRADIKRPPFDEKGYEAQQKQRAKERKIRDAKLEQAAAIDSEGKALAAKKVRQRQAELRDHMAANSGQRRDDGTYAPKLKRQSDREQISGRFATPAESDAYAKSLNRKVAKQTSKTEHPVVSRDGLVAERFGRLDKRESMDVIASKSNPGNTTFFPDPNYANNCHMVVSAVEMRARGYNVVARPTTGGMGRSTKSIESDYQGGRKFTEISKVTGEGKSMLQWVENEFADAPEGARGFVTGAWSNGRGAHIWNWEKKGGKITYHEGQVAATVSSKAESNVLRLDRKTIAVMRVDDLEPADQLIDALQSEAASRLVGEAAVADLIKRVEERLLTLKAERARFEASLTDTDKGALASFKRAKGKRRNGRYDPDVLRADGFTRKDIEVAYAKEHAISGIKKAQTSYRKDLKKLQAIRASG